MQLHIKLAVAILLAISPFIAHAQLSGLYTIDNGGSGDYLNFSDAVSDLNTMGVSGTVTLQALAGSGPYNEQFTLEESGTSTNPIVLDGNGTTISYSPTVADYKSLIRVNQADYIEIRNFNLVVPDGATFGWGIHLFGRADYITISNCTVTVPTVFSTNGFSCLVVNKHLEFVVAATGKAASFTTVENSEFSGGYYGVSFHTELSSLEEGIVFKNNHLSDAEIAFYATRYENVTFEGNVIRDFDTGLWLYDCTNTSVVKNDVAFFESNGMFFIYCNGDSGPVTVANNFVSNPTNITGASSGIRASNCSDINFWHNSVNFNTSIGEALQIFQGANVDIRNNSLASVRRCIDISDPASLSAMDYNNYFRLGPSAYVGEWGGSTRGTLTSLQSAPGGPAGHNLNSTSEDPLYLTPTDLHASGVGLEGTAFPGLVSDDFDGDSRGAIPDIGADEYTNPLADAGIIEILNPVSTAPGVQSIDVKILNYGSTTLNSVDLYALVDDGSSPVLYGPTSVTGGVIPFGSTFITSIASHNFLPDVEYTVTTWTDSPNGNPDDFNANDTLAVTQFFCNTFAGIYTIDQTVSPSGSTYDKFQTLLDEMAICGISESVIIEVAPGSGPYIDQFTVPPIPGTSTSRSVTIKGNNETIIYNNTVGGSYSVHIDENAKYISVEDFNFDVEPTDACWCVWIDQYCANITVANNTFNHLSGTDNFEWDKTSIMLAGSVTSYFGYLADTVVIEGNTIRNGNVGVHAVGWTSADASGLFIQNNLFDQVEYNVIDVQNHTGVHIKNNYSNQDSLGNTYSRAVRMIDVDEVFIDKNEFYGFRRTGLDLRDLNLLGTERSSVSGNFISSENLPGGSSFSNNLVELNNALNVDFHSNNLFSYGASGRDGLRIVLSTSAGISIRNNSIYLTNSGSRAIYISGLSNLLDMDYNNLSSVGSLMTILSPFTNLTSISQIQLATGDNANSVSGIPGYVSADDLHLTASSPLINIGDPSLTANDLDGEIRPDPISGLNDIGADEFGSTMTLCQTPANPNTIATTGTSATLYWDPVSGASAYEVEGRRVGSGGIKTAVISSNSPTFNIFSPGNTYEWRVRAFCMTDTSTYTAIQQFTTPSPKLGVQLSPVPADNFMQVLGLESCTVHNLNGQQIGQFNAAQGTIRIPTANLPAGLYLLRSEGFNTIFTVSH